MFGWFRKPRELHQDVARLAGLMRAIEGLLRNGSAPHWANQVARCADIVERSDAYGLESFLKLYGGMGSINDVVMYRDGAALVDENTELHELLSQAYDLGHRLKREKS